MATLWERLSRRGTPHIDPQQFCAFCCENVADKKTITELAEAFGLTTAQQTDAEAFINRIVWVYDPNYPNLPELPPFDAMQILMLADAGLAYTTDQAVMDRLQVYQLP